MGLLFGRYVGTRSFPPSEGKLDIHDYKLTCVGKKDSNHIRIGGAKSPRVTVRIIKQGMFRKRTWVQLSGGTKGDPANPEYDVRIRTRKGNMTDKGDEVIVQYFSLLAEGGVSGPVMPFLQYVAKIMRGNEPKSVFYQTANDNHYSISPATDEYPRDDADENKSSKYNSGAVRCRLQVQFRDPGEVGVNE